MRLVYLSLGLSVVLAFIGVKLVFHAMHENELPFINGGEHIKWAPEIPIWVSLGFIIVTLGITTILSLRKSRNMTFDEVTDDDGTADATRVTDEVSTAAAAGGGELDEATRAELEGLHEPEQSDSKKS